MKRILLFLFFTFSFTMQSQCFDCAKNLGGWNGDATADLKKTSDGIYLAKNGGNFGDWMSIYKYDFNCNLVWKKEIDERSLYISKLVIDSQDNIYVLFTWYNAHNAVGPFPQLFSGLPMYPGLNLLKFDKNGNFVWNRSIGNGADYGMRDIYIHNDIIYITGTFYTGITINNQITLTNTVYTGYYVYHPLLFIAKFDLNGNLKEAKKFGTSNDDYTSSEMDKNGDLYFSRYSSSNSNYTHSDIDKIDTNLNVVWSKEISNNKTKNESFYRPTLLYYNPTNDKLYLWGAFYKLVDILGTIYTDPNTGFYLTQSILSEFNITTGNLERIKQINNSSSLDIPGMDGNSFGNTAYLTEKGNELYIFSSFTGTMTFPNATIKSRTYTSGASVYNNEDLVLFKVNLNNFESEFILKSSGTNYYSQGMSTDAANPILFNGNDLYLTASFQSSPLTINGSVINNNSGNNASDVMFYKYKLDASTATGEIIAENTCFNTLTNFNVNGTFDSITWDFNDPNSSSNSATINNPTHQFSSSGTYHIKVIVNCGTDSQTLEKDITITNAPSINSVNPIYACESISGSGISNSFDTSNINSEIIGNQSNLVVEYFDSNGNALPSPLPNPYTNKNEETIIIRSSFQGNPYCFVETNLKLYTIAKPLAPTTTSTQNFCIQQNVTLNDIAISGQNIKWYDALTNGTLLLNTTSLQNGTTYYASQTINGCQSDRIPVLINIQNTSAPTGNASQTFCSSQNPTLDTIVVSGTVIKWYNASGTLLPNSTPLQDGATYYASQTENSCESPNKLAITVSLINTLPANNYAELFCDDLNDGSEKVNLSDYNSKLISSTSGYTFYYYSTILGAENQLAANQITNFSNYNLVVGDNKIYVRINSNNPCYAIVELKLTLLSKPIISIQDIVPICENNTITIDAGSGSDIYLWSTGATTSSIMVSTPGNFSVTVTNNYSTISCSSIKNFEVRKSNIATITSVETKDWTDKENIITIFASGAGDFEYSIDGIHFQDNNQFSALYSGEYTLHVRDKNGCGTATDEVFLLMYPKYFTPNGDGFNDTWNIKFSDLEINLTVKIFDRYGKLIKELIQNGAWNGTMNEHELAPDDYWFVATRADGKEYKGHFSLKR
ncbi:T9SS type B sorting domain-containing protein [Flavobacterium sp. GT3P67]|uniref:T9SS type B sorting domain-containing protein n=1 Tax=Flavobacterium sp. GT3P67 TaxID=2541722 RepID=UPI00104711A2|nr:T9SS type B sorting domain-containing protein [Flavobacterium sp. GT3P67]TDE51010.1 T9SS type B sorting domain-containing protein [Flavobacterium sp. GT3P67]